ncbi:MAG TPA: hypothetical protein VM487_21025 [Phycisphaerae bacterium]|nr:hypothetical protein [Phycisphaerae bacterium]
MAQQIIIKLRTPFAGRSDRPMRRLPAGQVRFVDQATGREVPLAALKAMSKRTRDRESAAKEHSSAGH